MHRKFITLIVAAAVAGTSFAAPARADSDDIAGALFGIAALALLGKALSNRNDDRAPVVQQHYQPNPSPVRPRPLPQSFTRYDLPGQCLRSYRVNNKSVRLFGAGCLQRNYRFTNSLPYACQLQFNNQNGSRTGYEPLCLRERGYRIARR